MDFLWDAITEWLKELLVGGITSNLSGMFDSVKRRWLKSPARWV